MSISANFPTSGPSLALNFVNSGQLDPRITFSRASGATWFNSAGTLVGVDFSSTSLTVGTGWQTLTLDATAGVDRNWIVGMPVQLIASTGTNTMTGVVVSYTASTQTLVVSVASVVGSGTYSTWRVSNLSPRFDYNPSTLAARGLLIEEQRTNLQVNSEDFTNVDWNKGTNTTITGNSTVAPSGQSTADTFGFTAVTSGTCQVSDNQTKAASAITYTGSIYVKASSGLFFHFYIDANGTTNSGRVIVDTTNWTVFSSTNAGTFTGTSGTVTSVGNGWYRITCTTTSGTETNIRFNLYWSNSNSTVTFTPSGTEQVYIWGAQLEAGAFPTSYIPTTTTALTRSADVASVNTLSPWFNATEGTLYGEVSSAAITVGGVSRRIANINDGTEADRITVAWAGATAVGAAFVTDNSVTQAGFNSPSGAYPFPTKVALAYKTDDFQAAVNGSAFAADTSGTVPTVNRMTIGDVVTGGTGPQNLNGHVRRIAYYPRRLSQAELTAITA